MITYDKAFDRLISHEGAFSDDPKDPGNWTGGRPGRGVLKGTKFGIAANTYGHLDIQNLTLAQAKEIYKRDFWDLLGGKVHSAVKFQFFDATVNHGEGNAVRMLQRAVGTADDGHWGPLSQAALEKWQDENDLILGFIAFRVRFFTSLSTFVTYGRGWMNRIAQNLLWAREDNDEKES
jgi:lysozyme family protein